MANYSMPKEIFENNTGLKEYIKLKESILWVSFWDWVKWGVDLLLNWMWGNAYLGDGIVAGWPSLRAAVEWGCPNLLK